MVIILILIISFCNISTSEKPDNNMERLPHKVGKKPNSGRNQLEKWKAAPLHPSRACADKESYHWYIIRVLPEQDYKGTLVDRGALKSPDIA